MTVTQALHIKDKQRAEAEAKAEARTAALCKEIPALSEIDRKLARSEEHTSELQSR